MKTTLTQSKVSELTLISLMTALLCVLGPLSIQIGLVPLSLATFGVFLVTYVLGRRLGTLVVLLYLAIGLVGIPVFAGFGAGPTKLLGPTGGYLLSYVPMALIAGSFSEAFPSQPLVNMVGMLLANGVCYIIGSGWLAFQAEISLSSALAIGVLPFIVGDLIKIGGAIYLGQKLRKFLY